MAYPNYPDIDLSYSIPHDRVHYNVRYGPHIMQRLNIYKSPVQNASGNPVIVFMHGGGWSSNDKTRTVENSGNVQKALFSFLMDPKWTSGGPDGTNASSYVTSAVGVDIVSIEWRQYVYTQFGFGISSTRSSIYEEFSVPKTDAAGTGNVATTHSTYPTTMEDPQLAVQWVKDNASRYGFNASKVFLWGTSAGGNGALVASLRPSRRYKPTHLASHKYDRTSSSDVIGIINWYGQISMSPFYFVSNILGAMFGISESSDGSTFGDNQYLWRKRRDMERILLLPDASGLYTSASPLSPICKAISPSSMIDEFPWVRKGVKIYSNFMEWEDSLAPNSPYLNGYYTFEGIPPNGISSPWYGAGHEWRQFYDLSAVCLANGIIHDGKVVRSFGSIYAAKAYASAAPYNLAGNNTMFVSSWAGTTTITFPNSAGLSNSAIASSIILQASSLQVGAYITSSAGGTSTVIRATSGSFNDEYAKSISAIPELNAGSIYTADKYTGSAATFYISGAAVSKLGLSSGYYSGSDLNPINQIFNPIHSTTSGYYYTSLGETLKREMPRLYHWIRKTAGYTYIDDNNIWPGDPIK
jgi:hypothetical protein